MMDNIRLVTRISNYDLDIIQNRFRHIGNRSILNLNEEGIYMTYYKDTEYLLTWVKLDKFLRKDIITGEDLEIFKEQFSFIFYNLLGFKSTQLDFKINRVDFKLDLYFNTREEMYQVLNQFKKCNKQYRYLKQTKDYDTSVYFISGSYRINIYDKFAQSGDERYRNMLRLEIQLKKPYLDNKRKSSKFGLVKVVDNYFWDLDRDYTLNIILYPILFAGDYYTTAKIFEILKENESKTVANNIVQFLEFIEANGMDQAKKEYRQFSKYVKVLEKYNINPITIDEDSGVDYISNPIKLVNPKQNNIYIDDSWTGLVNSQCDLLSEVNNPI